MEVNAFVLYGLPHEHIDDVVKSILFVSETVGSIIPMLFTPVPSTALYQRYFSYFKERGWDIDLHMLNGKLYPFLYLNEGSVNDYVDLQRFMYMLNAQHRSRSFQLFGNTLVAQAFRSNMRNGFEAFVTQYKQNEQEEVSASFDPTLKNLLMEYPPKPGHYVTSITYDDGLMTLPWQGQRIDLR
jgi:radical SAM superfamily enzyme YgiQ (UPF0313 family)